jgi:hypothetical protein
MWYTHSALVPMCLLSSSVCDVANTLVLESSDVNHRLLLVDVNGVELCFFSDLVKKAVGIHDPWLVLREGRKL